ncbi:MAG: hypothetical protein E6R08_06330 [Nevskiaceae bacterium]|nr:MAG: hypothetical protein E6R08_06330 [Nevskiaceae bacterium]
MSKLVTITREQYHRMIQAGATELFEQMLNYGPALLGTGEKEREQQRLAFRDCMAAAIHAVDISIIIPDN